jgi:hypothetical protein
MVLNVPEVLIKWIGRNLMRIEFRIKVVGACIAMSAVWITVAFMALTMSTDITAAFMTSQAIDINVATQDFAHARQNLQYKMTISLAMAAGLSGLITVWILQTYERTLTRPILAIQRLAKGDTSFRYRRADLDPSLRSNHDPIAKLLFEVSRVGAVIERQADASDAAKTRATEKTQERRALFGARPSPSRQKPEKVQTVTRHE